MRIQVYRTYRWIDKDPIIDAIRTLVQTEKLSARQVHEISGLAVATVDNWFKGNTRRPQNATITAMTAALGYVRRDQMNADGTVTVAFAKARELDWTHEIEKQASFLVKNPRPKRRAKRIKRSVKRNGATSLRVA